MSGAYASYFNLSEEALLSLVTQMETFAVCAGSLSFIASSMVVMTVYLFPSMWHNKIYMQMIVMTSVCDLLASFAVILGYPSGSLCTFQGTLIMFCFRGAWFWSVLMLLQLNHIVQYSKVLLSFRMMNILVWLTNLLLELLPLTTGDWYTNAKQFQGKIVCTLDFYDNNFYVWICTCFVGPLNLTVLSIMFLATKLIWKLRYLQNNYYQGLVRSILAYPIVMLVCFVPFWILFFKDFNVAPDGDITNFSYKYRVWTLIYSWTAMQGFFNCIIFFVNSVEARERWKTWLSKYICCADKGLSDRQEMLSMWSEDFLTDDDMVKIPSTSHTSASGSTGLSTTSSLSSSSYLSSGVSSRFTEESVNSAI